MAVTNFESGSSFPPLPSGEGGDDVIRSARFIDVEILGELSAREINADNITSGTLSADRIAVGSLDGDKITAGTITADRLTVTSLDAITATMGTLTVNSTLTMTPGGVFRTAVSGERFEFSFTDRNRLHMYTGDGDETYAGRIVFDVIGSGATAALQTDYELGSLDIAGPDVEIRLSGVSRNNSTKDASFTVVTRNAGAGSALETLFWQSGRLHIGNGSAASPAYTFNTDTGIGMYRLGSGQLAFATGGAIRGHFDSSFFRSYVDIIRGVNDYSPRLRAAASNTTPGYTFYGDTNTGMYRISADRLGFTTGGNLGLEMTSSLIGSMFIYNTETGDAANVNVNVAGFLQRSTSARKYKSRINYNIDYLADYKLRPAKFYRKDDKAWYLGFIADDLADENKLLGTYDDDGEIENYDQRAVIAVLAAKVNRLEKQVKEMAA